MLRRIRSFRASEDNNSNNNNNDNNNKLLIQRVSDTLGAAALRGPQPPASRHS